MMAHSTRYKSKPELQTIFDSISSKDFNTLHSVLNPLTLHDRRCIVNQKLHGKSTLYHAIECGSKPIVKYLLVDCMANVLQESWNGTASDWPLRKVVEKLDIFMLFIMKRYSGHPLRRYKIKETVDYTLKVEYYSAIWFLGLRISEILQSERGSRVLETLRLTNLKGRKSYNMRSEMFLEVTLSGDLNKLKLLVAGGVDIHLTNDKGENGLSLAILNQHKEVVDFLLEYKVYSFRSFACSLELCGAKLIIFHPQMREGIYLWWMSVQIRKTLEHGFADKNRMTELGSEFKTENEITKLRISNDGSIYLQALMIFRRLLHRSSLVTINAFIIVIDLIDKIKPLYYLTILCEMFDLVPVDHIKRALVEKKARDGVSKLNKIHFLNKFSNSNDDIDKFQELLHLLDPHFWRPRILRMPLFFVCCYTSFNKTLLNYLPLMQSRAISSNDEYWIRFNLRKIIQADLYPYPSSLLHIAIQKDQMPPVILFLLECNADPNGKDIYGDTPLHLVGYSSQPRSYLLQMTDLLIRAGGHIDSINGIYVRPMELLVERGLIRYPLKHISLQCLAAQAITTHSIFVDEEKVSKAVFEYVKIHSIHKFNHLIYF